eukprot:GILJ01014395.1.p1 GENE.GILJ01014395.1~~GILJ01014395.1.p1  ORF type:complete len:191 (+),score=35.36 GILJ01014395.1:259-831(+)
MAGFNANYMNAKDGISLIISEHRKIDQLVETILNIKHFRDEKQKFFNEFVKDLSQHSELELQLLYPLIRDRIPDGPTLADRSVHEHQEVEKRLNKLTKYDVEDVSFNDKLHLLWRDIKEHVKEEEDELLPKLRVALTPDEQRQLFEDWQSRKKFVPTRPHPHLPKGAAITNAAVKAVDSVFDKTRIFPKL